MKVKVSKCGQNIAIIWLKLQQRGTCSKSYLTQHLWPSKPAAQVQDGVPISFILLSLLVHDIFFSVQMDFTSLASPIYSAFMSGIKLYEAKLLEMRDLYSTTLTAADRCYWGQSWQQENTGFLTNILGFKRLLNNYAKGHYLCCIIILY